LEPPSFYTLTALIATFPPPPPPFQRFFFPHWPPLVVRSPPDVCGPVQSPFFFFRLVKGHRAIVKPCGFCFFFTKGGTRISFLLTDTRISAVSRFGRTRFERTTPIRFRPLCVPVVHSRTSFQFLVYPAGTLFQRKTLRSSSAHPLPYANLPPPPRELFPLPSTPVVPSSRLSSILIPDVI